MITTTPMPPQSARALWTRSYSEQEQQGMHDQGIDLTDSTVRLYGGWTLQSPTTPGQRSARMSKLAKRPRRETQQQKVYDAESILWGATVGTTKAEVQSYVDRVANYEWFRRRWGSHRFHVETQRGVGGHGGYGDVSVGLNTTGGHGYEAGAQRNVVLHEMAHTLAQGKDPEGNWHGPYFARTMLELVQHAVGAEEGRKLRESYKAHRVKLGSPTPLRAPERTPAAHVVQTPKLWRVEYKLDGQTKTTSIEATSMARALQRLADAWVSNKAEVTNLKVWRGVRPTTPTKRAASKRPREAAPLAGG